MNLINSYKFGNALEKGLKKIQNNSPSVPLVQEDPQFQQGPCHPDIKRDINKYELIFTAHNFCKTTNCCLIETLNSMIQFM